MDTRENASRRPPMLWILILALLIALSGAGCAGEGPEEVVTLEEPVPEETPEAQEEAQEEVQEVEFLFVHYAEGVTLENNILTLERVGKDVLYFSDRPHRIVGRETMEEFLDSWHQGEESFAEIPPNAVLVAKEEEQMVDLTVVLKDPVLTDGTLVYQVEILDGPESGSGDFAALFIDTIGFVRPPGGKPNFARPPGGKPNFLGRRGRQGSRNVHRRGGGRN